MRRWLKFAEQTWTEEDVTASNIWRRDRYAKLEGQLSSL